MRTEPGDEFINWDYVRRQEHVGVGFHEHRGPQQVEGEANKGQESKHHQVKAGASEGQETEAEEAARKEQYLSDLIASGLVRRMVINPRSTSDERSTGRSKKDAAAEKKLEMEKVKICEEEKRRKDEVAEAGVKIHGGGRDRGNSAKGDVPRPRARSVTLPVSSRADEATDGEAWGGSDRSRSSSGSDGSKTVS